MLKSGSGAEVVNDLSREAGHLIELALEMAVVGIARITAQVK